VEAGSFGRLDVVIELGRDGLGVLGGDHRVDRRIGIGDDADGAGLHLEETPGPRRHPVRPE